MFLTIRVLRALFLIPIAGLLYSQAAFATTGVITTVAGNGSFGYNGDNIPATNASLFSPTDAAADAAGNLFIADTGNHRVRRVDAATGIITTVAGTGSQAFGGDGGPATNARLSAPQGVALDAAGNLFIADFGTKRIRRVDAATGIITAVAGNGIPGFSGDGGPATSASLNFPTDVTLDAAGNLFIADRSNSRIRKVGGVSVPPNRAPVANAGPDQTVNEGAAVSLDGSGSIDPESQLLTFQWTQLAGPTVSLSNPTAAKPTFVAPSVPVGGATLTFQLTVSDGQLTSTDTMNVTVKNVNHPPVANAGGDQTVAEGALVTLDGSASFDSDGEPLTFSWAQTAGPSVSLSNPTAAKPTFIAPLVGPSGATLTFALTVSDGIDSASDTVNVVVENVNHPPVANAGGDQTKDEGSVVMLDGGASSDPDGDPLTFTWTQLTGPMVTLSNPTSPTPTFTAPLVGPGGETLVFQLTVADGFGGTASDTVAITVVNINDPPACGIAQASPALFWPPNHKMVPAGIVGVTDPNNDQVIITVTGVTQDEPVNGLGDGDTSPDAVPQGAKVLLRMERSGTGNGRVYRVSFTADDGASGQCTGSVTVCVPHSRQPGTCVDSGQLYNSLQP